MNFFGNKNKAKNIDNSEEEIAIKIIERPRICCIDISDETVAALKKSGANISVGTFGNKICLPNPYEESSVEINSTHVFPNNIQEFDIFLIDLQLIDESCYDYHKENYNDEVIFELTGRIPIGAEFDPRPLSASVLKSYLNKIQNRPILIIAFSGVTDNFVYGIRSNLQMQQVFHQTNIYSFWNGVPINFVQSGKNTTICDLKDKELFNLLEKYNDKFVYNQTFFHPTVITNPNKLCDNFVPLINNINGDIISFIEEKENKTLIVLPQLDDKTSFLLELLTTIAPSKYPILFPFSTLHKWKEEEGYWLPNHSQLVKKKRNVEASLRNQIDNINIEIDENKKGFSFLHDILTETNDLLKFALIKYFKWLEFDDVIDYDEIVINSNAFKEEDIQVKLPDNGLLVIECKGIAGTSKDHECSKVLKYKNRQIRKAENNNVYALYIVNHQIHKPPLERESPPFTPNQIQDAINDERSLLTTWQLFNVFFEIEKGIITKKEVRESIIQFGLIDFKPSNLIFIYEPKEIIKDGYVSIVNICNINILVNDILFIEKNGKFEKVEVLDIQFNGESLQNASNGEFGLKLSSKITSGSKIWKKKVSL